jgi:(2Fe-2S) ferredoxin
MNENNDDYIFMCTNYRQKGKSCSSDEDETTYKSIKANVKEFNNQPEQKKVRVCKTSCLGKCGDGPVVLFLPENIWHSYTTSEDLTEAIHQRFYKKRS